jgi:hypothetical protein
MLYQGCISGVSRVKDKFIEVGIFKNTFLGVSLYNSRRTAPQPNLPGVNVMISTVSKLGNTSKPMVNKLFSLIIC